MSPNLKYLIWFAVIATIFVFVGMPIIDWFNQVTEMVATDSQSYN